mgnify:FL=1
MKHKATWELKNIIKALTIMEVLNTNEENNSTRRIRREENKRLNDAKLELKERKDKELWKYISNISWQVI